MIRYAHAKFAPLDVINKKMRGKRRKPSIPFREVSFFTRRGAPENGGSGTLSKIKGGSKDFFKLKKGDHLYLLKK